MVFIPPERDFRPRAAHNQEPEVQYITGKGPYFVGPLGALPGTPPNERTEFKIFDLKTIEGVNQLGLTTVKTIVPTRLLEDIKDSSIKTTEDFLASQMLKPLTICVDRPSPELVPKEYFQLQTWHHGIVTSTTLEIIPQCDIATFELRPFFWILTQQNNYRSFYNKNVKEILEIIFKPYQEKFEEKFQVTFDFASPSPRIQVIQMGETDFELVIRLINEEGLAYFFYHDKKTCYLVITDKVSSAFDKIEKEFSNAQKSGATGGAAELSKPLSFMAVVGDERSFFQQIEGIVMPLFDLKISYTAATSQLKVQSFPEYRSNGPTMVTALQEAKLLSKSDGFQPAQFQFVPMSTYLNTQTQDKVEHLQNIGARYLARDFSSKLERSANTGAYGFIPIWRKCNIDVTLNNKRNYQKIPVDYKSDITDEFSFYPHTLTHHYMRSLQSYFFHPSASTGIQAVRINYIPFNVEMKFFDVGNDDFKPPLEIIPISSAHAEHRHSGSSRHVFSAVVVDFQPKPQDPAKPAGAPPDKLESHDVPNMVCIRFPWHDDKGFVRARVAFSWTGKKYGSLFMPEVGSEVIVVFLDGDKDYPVIVGSCYNSKNPYPLDEVVNLDLEGDYGTRGVVFKEGEAELTYKAVKNPPNPTTQVFTLSTGKGNLFLAGSNVDTEAKSSYSTTVTDSDSSIKLDNNNVTVSGFSEKAALTLTKNGEALLVSKEMLLTADSKIDVTGSVINANKLKLPK